jgi:hypothetical protein
MKPKDTMLITSLATNQHFCFAVIWLKVSSFF